MVAHIHSGPNIFGAQSLGKRSSQQDGFAISGPIRAEGGEETLLLILADGMGGHAGGTHASQTAIKAFTQTFERAGGKTGDRLKSALLESNTRLASEIEANQGLAGMGSTLLGVVVFSDKLEWISVGDSILWHYKDGQLVRLNADHSMRPVLDLQIARGELTARQAAQHPQRNELRSALVGEDIELIDSSASPVSVNSGDCIILGSDGVLTLSEEEIKNILKERSVLDPKKITSRLLDAVEQKKAENQDNTTILVAAPPFTGATGKRGVWGGLWFWILILFAVLILMVLWN